MELGVTQQLELTLSQLAKSCLNQVPNMESVYRKFQSSNPNGKTQIHINKLKSQGKRAKRIPPKMAQEKAIEKITIS